MVITVGIDVGAGVIKTVLFKTEGDNVEWLDKRLDKIRRRDPYELTEQAYDEILAKNNLTRDDIG